MTNAPTIVWMRYDLRVADNPALHAATVRGAVLPVFIWAPDEEDIVPGSASKWWLHQSLKCLLRKFSALGSPLIIRKGDSFDQLQQIMLETGANAVYWNRRFEPKVANRDAFLIEKLRAYGIKTKTFNANLLLEPGEIMTKQGRPYAVFTPFWKNCINQLDATTPLSAPTSFIAPSKCASSMQLDSLQLESKTDWSSGFRRAWAPGTAGAALNLKQFAKYSLDSYEDNRDFPGLRSSSCLSPHLHFGETSARQVLHAVQTKCRNDWQNSQFISELGWREFAHHLLHHFPKVINEPLRPSFSRFPWKKNHVHLKAWQRGQTGYPLVDAGMRELWATGWMHNRVRMVAASFLVKHLLIHWREGAKWFWDTLTDADLASNTFGWQWVAGCGADAAPYFRIFNPVTQGERFDPEGEYVCKWIPELHKIPSKWIHKPWTAPSVVLQESKMRLGQDYPVPIVDHQQARKAALAALQSTKELA